MYYVLAALTVGSLWMLRRQRVPLSPVLAPIVMVTAAAAAAFGGSGYRAPGEVVLVLTASLGLAALATRAGAWVAHLPRPRQRPFPCFDGLRALAVLSVVAVHTAFQSGLTERSRWGTYTSRLEIGVAVFFLISGFLLYRPFVASHLGERPPPPVGPYLRRRLLRIVPAYWVALFLAAYVLHTVGPIRSFTAVIAYFGLLQIYSSHYLLGGISGAWTLCVEMSFYLFLPVYAVIVARVARRRPSGQGRLRAELLGIGGLCALSIGWKAFVFATPTWQQTGAGTWLPAQLDLFAMGMALAVGSVWWSEHRQLPAVLRRPWMPGAAWAGALVVFWVVSTRVGLSRLAGFDATGPQILARQWLYGAFAVLLLLPAIFGPQDRGGVRRLLRSWPLSAVGVVSYGIYLWHGTWMREARGLGLSFLTLTAVVVAASLASATISYVMVERRAQRWGSAPRSGTERRPGGLAAGDGQVPEPVSPLVEQLP
jgi:peptidoglycan/LPS O-acetylase OafA/YrhL